MRQCSYCEEKNYKHVDSQPIINVLSKLDKDERAKLVRFLLQVEDRNNHTTVAMSDIEHTYCFSCGSVMERDDDGDRYIYMCPNMECKSWNGGDKI